MSKGQGLPMTAIAIIIIILVTIVGVVLFFFTSFSEGQSGTSAMNCQQKCSTIEVLARTNGYSGSEICSMSKKDEYQDKCPDTDCVVNVSDGPCKKITENNCDPC